MNPPHSLISLVNTRNKKIKPEIHSAFSFCSTIPGTKRRTHLRSRYDHHVWLLVGQFPIKAEWWDVSLALRDFSRSNLQKYLANVAIGLHSHPHLRQTVLPILSCVFKLIYFSQLFPSSGTKCFLEITLRGSISNGFSVFICLIISSSISEKLLASEKDFELFFAYPWLLTLPVCF